jgi:hypothetical protein
LVMVCARIRRHDIAHVGWKSVPEFCTDRCDFL